ncbi:MAG TPA: DUF1343 domain-containing protein [Candidatus Coprenecus merdipullorum]|nr:DUF1343 domain-containing protein [Candidatus Coprenecus merdipullorum]
MKLSGTYHLSTTAAAVLILTALTLIPATATAQTVLTGIDVLEANGFEQLQGKRIGLVTNPTGVDRYLNSTIDVLNSAPGVELVALFGPEHGVRGNAHAGEHVEGQAVDPRTGVPIFSLYGKTRLPSAEQFKGLDAIVYDIQDIGCRSYTYISTMGNVMKVAAMEGVEMIILDRPNPLGGLKVEGPGVDKSLISFVGQYNIPYIYGLTPGELATLLNEEGILSVKGSDGRDSTVKCRLTVVKMEGWKRGMNFDDTGLFWVPSSPHIPTVEAAYLYPATGILGELGTVSIGVGYTLPFGMIAREGMDADLLASRLNSLCLPGILFRPIYATPFYGSLKGREIGGVQIYITDFGAARLSEIQFYVMQVLRELDPTFGPFAKASASQLEMFDKVTGSKEVRRAFGERYRYEDIFSIWNDFADKFREVSKKYYLYGL